MSDSRPVHPKGCSNEFTELMDILILDVDEPLDVDEGMRMYLHILHLVDNS